MQPNCGGNRLKRQANNGDSSEGTPATIEVSSGLYVNEVNDLAKASEEDSVYSEKVRGALLFIFGFIFSKYHAKIFRVAA